LHAAQVHRDQKHQALKGRYSEKARLNRDEITADSVMHPVCVDRFLDGRGSDGFDSDGSGTASNIL